MKNWWVFVQSVTPVESEHIADVKICNIISVNLVCGESEMHLLCVQVDICGDGYVL